MTRRRFGWIGWIISVLVVAAIAVGSVAGLTATGMLMIGEVEEIGAGSAATPLMVKAGYVRNTSPWPLEITSVTVDGTPLGAPVAIVDSDDPPAVDSPSWSINVAEKPVAIDAGAALAIWVQLAAAEHDAIGFDSLTLGFTGPLGFGFAVQNDDVGAVAFSPELPESTVSFTPRADDSAVNRFVTLIRDALASNDTNGLVAILRPDATADDALAFQAKELGIAADTDFSIAATSADQLEYEVQFLVADGVEVPPTFIVEWRDYRWSVTAAQP
jgi:hypothetical protein